MVTRVGHWLRAYGPWLLLLAALWGWRETYLQASYQAAVWKVRWDEQEMRLDLAREQVDALLSKLGLPKWWKNWRPKEPAG